MVDGLTGLTCPGRVERFLLADNVLAVVDVAHNEDSVAHCVTVCGAVFLIAISLWFSERALINRHVMLRQLTAIGDEILLTRFHGNPRFVEPDDLCRCCPRIGREMWR